MKRIFSAGLIGVAIFSGSAQAAVLSVSGQMAIIDTPTSVTNASPNSDDNMLVFNEIQNLVLTADLMIRNATNTGNVTLTKGTRVSSQMILLNRVEGNRRLVRAGAATFDGLILGLVTSTDQLLATDGILGAIGTSYATFRNRGLERGDGMFSGDDDTLRLSLRVTQPGDWMRVVTVAAVPVPAAGFLLFGALGGLAALRRRKALAV